MNIICPITLEEIQEPGITLIGSIYEYDAIHKWLTNHNTDPITNIILPSKTILKWGDRTESLTEYAAHVKNNTMLYNYSFRLACNISAKYDKLLEKYQTIKNDRDWLAKTAKTRKDFLSGKSRAYPCRKKDQPSCNFLNLSNSNVTNGHYKCETFNFSNLSGSKFINCDFSRCKFIGSNLTDCVFINCVFIGEQVIFYKATVTNLKFINCAFEYTDRWFNTTHPNEIRQILKQRLIDEEHLDDVQIIKTN